MLKLLKYKLQSNIPKSSSHNVMPYQVTNSNSSHNVMPYQVTNSNSNNVHS